MSFPVLYTDRAKETFEITYNFVSSKFGKNAADKFLNKAEKTISLIAVYPYMFKASIVDERVRIGFITKQCSLFYKVKESSVDLLFFWDNRQKPIFNYRYRTEE